MSMIKDLRLSCIKYDLEFPDFIFTAQNHNIVYCSVYWYGEGIVSSYGNMADEKLVLENALKNLNMWLEDDRNFIYLCHLDKKRRTTDMKL